ncbi:MAG: hypothetical protein VX000_12775, partial [Myxococcota bacterium]|nr:hypothetical protein [Myxococcota bacterium]
MPVTPRATDTPPVIAWLGSPPPAGVAESLASIATSETRWTPDARLIAVWAPAGVAQLGRLPARTRRPPVIAAVQTDPPHGERMEWIRAGADDLVSLAALPITVARRLERRRGDESDPRGGHEPDPAAPIQPLGAPNRRVPARLQPPEQAETERGADAFPPLQIPQHADGPMQGAADWVQSIGRYLPAREEWIARWGPNGLERMLELS